MQVDFAEQNFFLVVRSFREHAPEWITEKRTSPEFEPFPRHRVAADVASFEAYAIHHANINSVRDGVRALNGAPSVMLRLAEFGLLRGMPSDSRRVKKNACSLQGGEARAFGIPLVPADERAESPGGGVEGFEAEVAGSEIKFLVVERIVGDVHLAVDAAQRAICIEDRGRVVIETGRALLEERRDQHDFISLGGGGKLLRARAGNRLGKIEQSGVFALAEILGLEEFGQADDVRAFSCRLRNTIERFSQIVSRLWATRHLDQGDGEFISHFGSGKSTSLSS